MTLIKIKNYQVNFIFYSEKNNTSNMIISSFMRYRKDQKEVLELVLINIKTEQKMIKIKRTKIHRKCRKDKKKIILNGRRMEYSQKKSHKQVNISEMLPFRIKLIQRS